MAKADDMLQTFDELISDGVRRGLVHNVAEDDALDGRTVTVDGARLVNFGSCRPGGAGRPDGQLSPAGRRRADRA
ncbi:hypothetical protein ACQEVZ_43890 [Dactylosporangium sp. CA-152071]|uniref:hypothetical protein n=1 Tax=Dactylosporangium sp. CA-152071 TaxID=3239933 RepID=UPI003D9218F9